MQKICEMLGGTDSLSASRCVRHEEDQAFAPAPPLSGHSPKFHPSAAFEVLDMDELLAALPEALEQLSGPEAGFLGAHQLPLSSREVVLLDVDDEQRAFHGSLLE